jgi:DNA-binding response OmpR family regulator
VGSHRNTLQIIFTQSGYSARATYNSAGALAIAEAWPPDLLIAEIILRDMNGVELAKRLTALHPKCRVILFSAQVASQLIIGAGALGFEFFDKPVNPAILLGKAAILLGPELKDSFG